MAFFKVKPDVLLMGTLQPSAVTLVFDWQFESSKLQSAGASEYWTIFSKFLQRGTYLRISVSFSLVLIYGKISN